MLTRLREPWSDRRAELTLGALACAVLLVIVLMVVFVANEAWPTFKHNGLSWLGPGGNVDEQRGDRPVAAHHRDIGRLDGELERPRARRPDV